MLVHQYDNKGFYAGQSDTFGGPMPHGCVATAPASLPWDRVWPHWNGSAWEMVPDHRSRRVEEGFAPQHVQSPTDYWLPEDTYLSPARHMTEIGALPEGALRAAPVKSAEVEAEERARELKSKLDEIDRKSARPLRAVAAGTATDEDRAMLVDLEARAAAVRVDMRETISSLAVSN